jgi:hypothetical protein
MHRLLRVLRPRHNEVSNMSQNAAHSNSFPSGRPVVFRNATVLTHEQKAQALTNILTHAAAGRCTVERETVPLAKAAEAWERQAAFAHRKLILVP